MVYKLFAKYSSNCSPTGKQSDYSSVIRKLIMSCQGKAWEIKSQQGRLCENNERGMRWIQFVDTNETKSHRRKKVLSDALAILASFHPAI